MEFIAPSTISFEPQVIQALKPTFQKVVSKEDFHLVLFFTKSQCEQNLSSDIQNLQDSNASISFMMMDKFPLTPKDIDETEIRSTKNLMFCFNFLLTQKELSELIPHLKNNRIGLCTLQPSNFFQNGGNLLYEYPAENIVNFVHTDKSEDFLWFIWGGRSNTRSEYITLSIKQHELLPRHLEEGLNIKRRLEEGESMENLAKEYQMDRSTLHKKVKVAKYLDQYPQLRHFSLNKGLEFVRGLEEKSASTGRKDLGIRAQKEWSKWTNKVTHLNTFPNKTAPASLPDDSLQKLLSVAVSQKPANIPQLRSMK